MPSVRRASLAAAVAALPMAAAYRFAIVYRERAGIPRRRRLIADPGDLGMAFQDLVIQGSGTSLSAWFIPATRGTAASAPEAAWPAPGASPGSDGTTAPLRPAIVLVHGWESARDRLLPMAAFLHAAGFHVLMVDVRGHGANASESLPVSGGEFGADARAAVEALTGRPEVGSIGIVGHSMGAIGALLAAADDPRIGAVVAISAPADPVRLTRRTFQLARLPIPDPVAYPLAWVTANVYVRPRRHRLPRVSATRAVARYGGPLLLIHGDADTIVPLSHHRRLVRRAAQARRQPADQTSARRPRRTPPAETMIVPGGGHSWLYEDPAVRSKVAAFLARSLGGPFEPQEAARRAIEVDARRLAEPEEPFSGTEPGQRGMRLVAELLGAPIQRPRPPSPPEH
jgi:pimeloyl-ACP methyl ester carboxylesterase